MRRRRQKLAALATAVIWPLSGPVRADTLVDAIALAYQSNPQLLSLRAQLQALNENYVQARAGLRPTLSVQAAPSLTRTDAPALNGFPARSVTSSAGGAQVSLTQPIYTGGRTSAAVRAAEADILSGRQTLRQAESDLLLRVITAYVDLIRAARVVEIRENDVLVLQSQVDDAEARLTAGEITRTDLTQSQSQLANARTFLLAAQGTLQSVRAVYNNVVGRPAGKLEAPPSLPGLPSTLDSALDAAEEDSARLQEAQLTARAAAARVSQARAASAPTVSLQAQLGYSGQIDPLRTSEYSRQLTASLVVTKPILSAGLTASGVRRARALDASARYQVDGARRDVIQSVAQNWSAMVTAQNVFKAEELHLDVTRRYFSNTQLEYTVGQRSTLDVLVAEQTLRDGEITLAGAAHDSYVASAQLLDSMGRLDVESLAGLETYDPAVLFRRVNRKGATPWEPLLALLDKLGGPRDPPPSSIAPLTSDNPEGAPPLEANP